MIKVTAAIIEKNGKIMIAKRKQGIHLEGLWEFPGGKINKGETPEQCLERELNEEFGVETKVGEFVADNEHYYEGRDTIKLMVYKVKWMSGDFKLNDHSEIVWVSIDEMKNYEFAPADIPIINKLNK